MLPEAVGELGQLREICLSLNQLTSIPPCLATCPKLETILIANNKVQMSSLKKIDQFGALKVSISRDEFFLMDSFKRKFEECRLLELGHI